MTNTIAYRGFAIRHLGASARPYRIEGLAGDHLNLGCAKRAIDQVYAGDTPVPPKPNLCALAWEALKSRDLP